MKNFIIFGASKGLGAAFAKGLPEKNLEKHAAERIVTYVGSAFLLNKKV